MYTYVSENIWLSLFIIENRERDREEGRRGRDGGEETEGIVRGKETERNTQERREKKGGGEKEGEEGVLGVLLEGGVCVCVQW
jgi:hypothetical protein